MFPNIPDLENGIQDIKVERLPNLVVTRTAPNTSGFYHIGFLYVALFNEYFAKFYHGMHLLRIDDTDKKNELVGAQERIINSLRDINVSWDEGPDKGGICGNYVQSERIKVYQMVAKYMVEHGVAYPCFCTAETLAQRRKNKKFEPYAFNEAKCRNISISQMCKKVQAGEPFTVRIRTKDNYNKDKIEVFDLYRGRFFLPPSFEDFIILKSNGLPTYHFAVVIDDYLMGVTHLVRSMNGFHSIPLEHKIMDILHILPPKYVHLDGIKIFENNKIRNLNRKCDKKYQVEVMQANGYSAAIIKCILTTILCPKENISFGIHSFRYDEVSPKNYNIKGAVLSSNMLEKIGYMYISAMLPLDFISEIIEFSKKYSPDYVNVLEENVFCLRELFVLYSNSSCKNQLLNLKSCVEIFVPLLIGPSLKVCNELLAKEQISISCTLQYLLVIESIDLVNILDEKQWKETLSSVSYKNNLDEKNIRDLKMVLRIILTGQIRTPDIFQIIQRLGVNSTKKRIANAIKNLV